MRIPFLFISHVLCGIVGLVLGMALLSNIQTGFGLTPPGVKDEVRPLIIKASAAEMVDLNVSLIATTEVNDEGLRRLVLPLNVGLDIAKRYAKGNGVCLLGTDNKKLRPYFKDRLGNRQDEVKANEKATLVVGEPEVLHCGVAAYEYFDGPSLPLTPSLTSLYNGIWGESLHQSVCGGYHPTLQRQARESLTANLKRAYAEWLGYQNLDVEFQSPRPPEISGTPVVDPSIRPTRACDPNRPEPILIDKHRR